jgi:arylsulfatase A-like enzyme
MLGDHFLLGKGGFFDQSFHIPLIVSDPRRKEAAGTRVEHFTEAVDVMPTLLDLLGETSPAHLDGKSLTPFLGGRMPSDWRDAAHWEFDFRSIEKGSAERHFGLKPQQCNLAVLRGERFKYVHFGSGLPPLLFDIEEDPGELKNLAADPSFQPVRLDFAERLLAWRAEHLDQSLALSALTENGVVGAPASLPPR